MGISESTLRLRSSLGRLTANDPEALLDSALWDTILDGNKTYDEIYQSTILSELRDIRNNAPQNLRIICKKIVEQLYEVASKRKEGATEYDFAQVKTCVRLITRLVPVIFEATDDEETFEDSIEYYVFWTPPNKRTSSFSSVSSVGEPHRLPPGKCLGEVLIDSLGQLAFFPGYTIPNSLGTDPKSVIWEVGIGVDYIESANSAIEANRADILRAFLACFSRILNSKPMKYNARENRWLGYFASHNNRLALPFFLSLLNTVCSYDPVGYGLPYSYMFVENRDPLISLCISTLNVLLDHDIHARVKRGENADQMPEGNPIGSPKVETSDQNNVSESKTESATRPDPSQPKAGDKPKPNVGTEITRFQYANVFCDFLSRLHRPDDLRFALLGFIRLIKNPFRKVYLPGAARLVSFYQELLILFWKFCDLNRSFLYFLLKSNHVIDISLPLLGFVDRHRHEVQYTGLTHLCIFILLLLSGERNFGVRLNRAYSPSVEFDLLNLRGNYADLLILVFHHLITSGHEQLDSLYDCMLTIIVNISPYIKSLNRQSASKLLHLFELFSSPKYVLSAPNNHHLVFFLLEIFNNLIQYQFDGNANVVYCIVRRRRAFDALANLHVGMSQQGSGDLAGNVGMRNTLTRGSAVYTKAFSTQPKNETLGSYNPRDPITPSNINEADIDEKGLQEWVPTKEWLQSWKSKLPLHTIARLLQVLVPQVDKLINEKGISDEQQIVDFLKNGTLVGLLPVPHPILIRKYQSTSGTNLWFTVFAWSIIYVRSDSPCIWEGLDIQLFN
eukprot:Clim_evm46s134 gene=Clim_evmTU46s134